MLHGLTFGPCSPSQQSIFCIAGAAASCKSAFVAQLVQALGAAGHRTLIFSQSRVMLDIMGEELRRQRLRFLRIDGSMQTGQREVRQPPPFLSHPSKPCVPCKSCLNRFVGKWGSGGLWGH